eukprot:scaffold46953_cov62-Phaeocystis_antarctica.AAC.3
MLTRYADAGVLEISVITAPAATGASKCPDYMHAAKAGSRVALSTVDTLWHAEASLHWIKLAPTLTLTLTLILSPTLTLTRRACTGGFPRGSQRRTLRHVCGLPCGSSLRRRDASSTRSSCWRCSCRQLEVGRLRGKVV